MGELKKLVQCEMIQVELGIYLDFEVKIPNDAYVRPIEKKSHLPFKYAPKCNVNVTIEIKILN